MKTLLIMTLIASSCFADRNVTKNATRVKEKK